MEKGNNNLPVPSKNKFIIKLKKDIFIVLSSLGIANNLTITAAADTPVVNVEQEISTENDF